MYLPQMLKYSTNAQIFHKCSNIQARSERKDKKSQVDRIHFYEKTRYVWREFHVCYKITLFLQ